MLLCILKHLVHFRQGYGVHGRLTEWPGSGLQNRVRRFESATDLRNPVSLNLGFLFSPLIYLIYTDLLKMLIKCS
jgi:hypothetical protein